LHYLYDNSTNNVRNPNRPPKRVRFGLNSADEMAELTFQVLPRNHEDYLTLAKDFSHFAVRVSTDYFAFRIKNDPNDAEAHKRLGRVLAAEGQVSEGIAHLRKAVELDPAADEPHYDLGYIYLRGGHYTEAYREFREDVRLNPRDFEALGSLGIICLQTGRPEEAQTWFEAALRANPDDTLAQRYLRMMRAPSR
jgi:tetratricopeptide (TPR) repeat protein